MARRRPYEDLPFLPGFIAEIVAQDPYKGQELSTYARNQWDVDRIEARRQRMTDAEVVEFADAVDARVKAAYEARARWFEKILRAPGNRGRDLLYMYIRHWLASYLTNPRRFLDAVRDSK